MGVYLRGSTYWIRYYRAGKRYQESSHSTKESDARRLLELRQGQIVEGRFPGLQVERTRFEDLAADFLTDYKVNGRKSLVRAERSVGHLKKKFEGYRASDITTSLVKQYIAQRLEQKASNASINRELSALKRMFHLGAASTPPKVVHIPHIPKLQEHNVRSGFFEHEDYIRLRDALPAYVKPVFIMGYHTGMRLGEIINLRWRQINLQEGKISLENGQTKNDEGRVVFANGELLDTLCEQKKIRDTLCPACQYVFFKDGERLQSFKRSWKTACKATGLEGKLFHDLRRTAVRDMVNAMIPEKVAMAITGHKTRSVFDRYHIVNEQDLERASKIVADMHAVKETQLQNSYSTPDNVIRIWRQ